MKMRLIGVDALVSLAVLSCTAVNEMPKSQQLEFRATWADEDETKTVLQSDGTSVWWSAGDEINIFYGTEVTGKFTSTNSTAAQYTRFTGTLPMVSGILEDGIAPQYFWGIYPYDAANTCDGESVTLTVSASQNGIEGTFADNVFPAIGRSNDFSLPFYNICGGARFSVANTGIQSVTFRSISGENLAGRVNVTYGTDGKPFIQQVTEGSDEVTVTAPAGGFVPGENYFAVFLPGTLSCGLKITYRKASQYADFTLDKAITVNRSRFGILDKKDEGLTFVPDKGISATDLPTEVTVNSSLDSVTVSFSFQIDPPQRVKEIAKEDISVSLVSEATTIDFDIDCFESDYDSGKINLFCKCPADELTTEEEEWVLQIRIENERFDPIEIIIPAKVSYPHFYYFDFPVDGFEKGLVSDDGIYLLLSRNTELGGFNFFVGQNGITDCFMAWIDDYGYFRSFAFGNEACFFDFYEEFIDIIWSDGSIIEGIPYWNEITSFKAPNKSSIWTNDDLVWTATQIGGIIANVMNEISKNGLDIDFKITKTQLWSDLKTAVGQPYFQGLAASIGIAVIDWMVPDEWQQVHDLLTVVGAVLSITSGPLGWALAAFQLAQLTYTRVNFGYATINTISSTILSPHRAIMNAYVTNTESERLNRTKSFVVRFEVRDSERSIISRPTSLVEGHIAKTEVSNLLAGHVYYCRARLFRSWIHNEVSHRNFRLENVSYINKQEETVRYSLFSLDGGEISFQMPIPGAVTGEVKDVYDRSAILGCSFSMAEEFTCGVQIGDGDKTWTISASSGDTQVSVGGLEPLTEYAYRAFVRYDGTVSYGQTRSFTTEPPRLDGSWNCTQYHTNNLDELIVESYTIDLHEDGTADINDGEDHYEVHWWMNGDREMLIYSLDVYWESGAMISRRWEGTIDDDYNRITGTIARESYSPNNPLGAITNMWWSFEMTR